MPSATTIPTTSKITANRPRNNSTASLRSLVPGNQLRQGRNEGRMQGALGKEAAKGVGNPVGGAVHVVQVAGADHREQRLVPQGTR